MGKYIISTAWKVSKNGQEKTRYLDTLHAVLPSINKNLYIETGKGKLINFRKLYSQQLYANELIMD